MSDSGKKTPVTDEAARKLREFQEQFPLGLAPFKRANLLAFAFLAGFGDLVFWRLFSDLLGLKPVLFPGGIVAAGIAGAINLRRANRGQSVPRLLVTTLVLALVSAFLGLLFSEWTAVNDPELAPGYRLMLFIVYIIIGMLYAARIARSQQPIYQRWLDLAGRPTGRDQGGCLGTFGWLALIIVVVLILGNSFYSLLVPTLASILSPQQRYIAEGIAITPPAGWASAAPQITGTDCTYPGVTCLATLRQTGSGSVANLLVSKGLSPRFTLGLMTLPLKNQYPSLAELTPQPYISDEIGQRTASTLSGEIGGSAFVYTVIADAGKLITVQLVCVNAATAPCEAIRDQFVAGLEFAQESSST